MHLLETLPWLPEFEGDFRRAVAELAAAQQPGRVLSNLVSCRLNDRHLHSLGKVIGKLAHKPQDFPALAFRRLGILSNGSTDFVGPALTASAARHGTLLSVLTADFGQVAEPVLAHDSEFIRRAPDTVLLAIDQRGLPLAPCPGNNDVALTRVAEAINYLDQLAASLLNRGVQAVILQTLAIPYEPLFGNFDASLPGTGRWLAIEFNRQVADLCKKPGLALFDVATLAESVGAAHWHDARHWNIAKLPFAPRMLPIWSDSLGRLLGALSGRSRKCLVLDLDNTLWGGVIGDDGLGGITLGNGNPDGEAYLALQQTAKLLSQRGIVLAVNSKNDDTIARRPFLEHPEMLLKLDDISVFMANWNDKASNCRAIASLLNFGLDALVLLDDNPAERDFVRKMAPEVAVPELPDDPALFSQYLLAAGYFEATAFTEEDRNRAASYQCAAQQAALLAEAGDYDSFLDSLSMVMTIAPFQAHDLERIAQLVNKTNQFNLTTKRYSLTEIEELAADSSVYALQVRLKDRFADHGLISVVICKREERDWQIDTWLMSCRVLKRRVEEAVLNFLAATALSEGAEFLVGEYRPTERNALVSDHYAKLGFVETTGPKLGGETGNKWLLRLAVFRPLEVPITLCSP